jgi:transcriptional regulator with XRE-family HTH domain
MSTATMPVDLSSTSSPFGSLLRGWRNARKLSQLDLSLEANVSQRHLSFLESGRAQPSREMVLQLAGALDVPLRERNVLLQSAGFAPLYRERGLDSADMEAVRRALELMLEHHAPLPAVVVNRVWDLVLANRAANTFLGAFAAELVAGGEGANGSSASPALNVMRLTFHPKGLQSMIANWEEVGPLLLSRLQREVAPDPANRVLREVWEEVLEYPSVAPAWRHVVWPATPAPVLPMALVAGGVRLELFTMISTFGTAQDVTADELRVECFFAANEPTRRFFVELAGV